MVIIHLLRDNMKKYKHKPTIVNCVQFKHNQQLEDGWMEWEEQHGDQYFYSPTKMESAYIYTYDTHDGYRTNKKKTLINAGDWIIMEKGKKSVMSNTEFKKYYDEITDEVDVKLLSLLDDNKEEVTEI